MGGGPVKVWLGRHSAGNNERNQALVCGVPGEAQVHSSRYREEFLPSRLAVRLCK